MNNKIIKFMAIFAVLAMLAVTVVPLTEPQSDGAVGGTSSGGLRSSSGDYYTYYVYYEDYVMDTGTNALDVSGMTPISHTGSPTTVASLDPGSWTWDRTTGRGPFYSFYAAFDMTDGNSFYSILDPYDLTRTIYGETLSPLSNYNIMWVIPSIYLNGNNDKLEIESDDFSGSAYAHTIDGHTYQYLAIGVYEGSTATVDGKTVLTSTSGTVPTANATRATFREYAHNYEMSETLMNYDQIPAKSMLWNFDQWSLYRTLCFVTMEDFNSQNKVGNGHVYSNNGTYAYQTGALDTMGPYAGLPAKITSDATALSYGSDSVKLFIENAWGGVREFVDGAVFNGKTGVYLDSSSNPTDAHTGTYVTYYQWPTAIQNGYPVSIQTGNGRVWGFPGSTVGGSDTTGTADYIWTSTNADNVMVVGGNAWNAWSSSVQFGLSSCRCSDDLSTSNASVGSRLAFVFDADLPFRVTISVNESNYGSVSAPYITDLPYGTYVGVSGNKITANGKTVTATSAADTDEWDYRFVNWTVNGSPYTGRFLYVDTAITANFEAVKRNYDVTITPTPTGYGTLSDDQITVPYGTSISSSGNVLTVGTDTVTATPSTATAQYTYAFDSWSGIPVGGTVTGDTAITATFTATVNDYTVTINSNNTDYGTVSPTSIANIPYGTVITVSGNTMTVNGTAVTATPATDTAEWDYSFVNWTVGGTPVTSSYTIDGDTTITANFDRSRYEYTVSFAVNEPTYGTVSASSVTDVPIDSTFTVNSNEITINGTTVTATATDTVQYDSTFVGWYDAATGGNEITSSSTVTSNMTVYARFTVTVNTYPVTIESNNTSYGTVAPTSISDVPYGTSITVSDNTLSINGTTVTATAKPGTGEVNYSFIRWQLNGTDISGTAITTDNTVLTAVFGEEVVTYTITWIVEGVSEQTTVEAGVIPTHTEPVKQYYTFKGWQPKVVAVTKDSTYTAMFEPTRYTVTWDANGGSVRPSSSVGTVETAVTVPTPTKDYFTFDGWYTASEGGDLITTPYMPTADVTFYAHWTVETYTVTFDANGGTAVTAMDGTQFTPIALPSTTYEGKNFAGWYTAANNGKLIGFNNTLYYPKGDITLYAHWSDEAVFTYSLNFDVNGGYNAPPAMVGTGTDNLERTFYINKSNPLKENLYFIGWATTPDATEPEYESGSPITIQANTTVTLYAVWSDEKPVEEFDWLFKAIAIISGIGVLLGSVALLVRSTTPGKDMVKSIIIVTLASLIYVAVMLPVFGLI